MADFPALGHVALTVRDIDVSRRWYQDLLGANPVLDESGGSFYHVVWALPNGTLLGIHTHPTPPPANDTFSEYRIGLDHLSFHCADRAELEHWQGHLDSLGYKHGGIVDAPYGSGLSFRDPDGNALEFFAPPS